MTANAVAWFSRRVSTLLCWYCVGCADSSRLYQGVAGAMTMLPGEAERVCLSTKTSRWVIIGNNDDSIHRVHSSRRQDRRLATWNCGGLSFTQRELCSEPGYDIVALTRTHDTGSLRSSKSFVTGEAT